MYVFSVCFVIWFVSFNQISQQTYRPMYKLAGGPFNVLLEKEQLVAARRRSFGVYAIGIDRATCFVRKRSIRAELVGSA